MPNVKVSALTDISTNLTSDDLVMVVNDPGGTPASRKATITRVREQVGGPIARTIYDPTATSVTAPTGATLTDVDATNLQVTFTVPPSGIVLIELTAQFTVVNASLYWGLRESSNDLNNILVAFCSGTLETCVTRQFYMTGLTPGNSKTYKFGHRKPSGTAQTEYGTANGPAIMAVYAIPQ